MHTPTQDKGELICQIINKETSITEWDTIVRDPKHEGERRTRHLPHPTASHQNIVEHAPTLDTGGPNRQLINKEVSNTEGVEQNPSPHYKFTEHTEIILQETG